MRKYEFTFILRPSLKDADKKKVLETIKTWLGDVKVVKEDDLGQKPLAYTIKREDAGHYYTWQLEGEVSLPKDFEIKLLREENMLRHLVLRTK